MKVARSIAMFGAQAAFRTTGAAAAGRALVRNLGDDDENVRTLAGMFLVQAGEKSVPLLREALARREHVENVLTMLADIAAPGVEQDIEPFLNEPPYAKAAGDAMKIVALRRKESP